MSEARYWFTATLLADGTVLAASAGPTDVYDPRTGAWTPTGPLPRDIDSIAAVLLADGRVLVEGSAEADVYCDNEGGGCEFGPTHSTELYTP